jgi:hypothetical protein
MQNISISTNALKASINDNASYNINSTVTAWMRRYEYGNNTCFIDVAGQDWATTDTGDFVAFSGVLMSGTSTISNQTIVNLRGFQVYIGSPILPLDFNPLSSRLRIRVQVGTKSSPSLYVDQKIDYAQWDSTAIVWNIPNIRFVPNVSGALYITITFISNGLSAGYNNVTMSGTSPLEIQLTGLCAITQRGVNQSLFGNNGTLQRWVTTSTSGTTSTSAQVQTAGMWAVRVGNYGLRITNSGGFEVTQDGGSNWKTVDLSKILS